jgi:hypothetical protein
MMRRGIPYLMLASVFVLACADASRQARTLVRDSAGVTIIDHGRIDPGSLPQWSLDPIPLVRIGTVDGDPEYQFHRVLDAIRLRDGSIAVIDNSRTLRLFDPEGRHRWTAGGDGDGPGEFRYPFMVREVADSLVVWDGAVSRLSIFSREGRFVRDATASDVQGPTLPRGLTGPRTILLEARRAERTQIDGHAALLHPADYHLVNMEGDVVRELGRKIFATGFQEVDENGAYSSAIFAVSAVIAPSHDGFWYGDTRDYELHEVAGPDRTRRIIRWQGADRTITEDDVRAVLEVWSQDATPEVRQFLIEYGRTHPRADRFPAYENLDIDRAGRLWVQDYVKEHQDDGRRRWLILSPDGTQVLARIEHDASLVLHDLDEEFVLAVQKDDLDVESIVLHRLVRDRPERNGNH